MSAPIATVNQLADALNRGDLEAALALYEPDAVLVPQPGQLARGSTEVRAALGRFVELKPSLRAEAQAIHSRVEVAMDWKQVITADPQILHGAVRFDGTRIPVTVVLDNLADGATPEEILKQYPGLRPEHIPAALAYAADLARERVVPIPA